MFFLIIPAAVAGFYIVPWLLTSILSLIGFTASGVTAGSLAALIQTPFTVAGGFFAMAQSIGAAGLSFASSALFGVFSGIVALLW